MLGLARPLLLLHLRSLPGCSCGIMCGMGPGMGPGRAWVLAMVLAWVLAVHPCIARRLQKHQPAIPQSNPGLGACDDADGPQELVQRPGSGSRFTAGAKIKEEGVICVYSR